MVFPKEIHQQHTLPEPDQDAKRLFRKALGHSFTDFWGPGKLPQVPRGSKYPISKDPGPKNQTLNGFCDQSP